MRTDARALARHEQELLGADPPLHEFIRRFLLHVLPKKYTRIRHYGLLAPSNVKTKLERARELLKAGGEAGEDSTDSSGDDEARRPEPPVCPVCGESMILVRTVEPEPRYPEGIDSS